MELYKNPKVSIIITYYNLGKYIEDCVLSILNQTYTNYEIIIVNDFSDEENSKVLKTLTNSIKIINFQENKGQLAAFLEGVKEATGEFVCMIDADDILLPDYLKTLIYVHLNTNTALVSSNKGEINENGEILSLNTSNKDKIDYEEIQNIFKKEQHFDIQKVKAPFALWSWNPSTSSMIRKSALDILKYYPDTQFWKCGADKVIFSFAHLIGGSYNISAVCFLYRCHSKNNFYSSSNTGDKKYLNEKCIQRLITWNKKLRCDTIYMFIKHKKELVEKYNKLNYLKMLFKVVFCIDIKICAKVIKTIAHKLINF